MSHPEDAFTGIVHPEVRRYLEGLGGDEDPLVERMEALGARRDFPLVGRLSGRWLELLTRMVSGRRVFELGSGFGYSAFFFARAVGEGGEVLGSEKDAWEIDAHRELYAGHPFAARVRIVHGEAFEVLDALPGTFDAVFVDIRKQDYPRALEAAVPRLRPGGLLLADNVLWGGRTARPAAPDDDATLALVEFNERLFRDPRLRAGVIPAGDGLAVAMRVA